METRPDLIRHYSEIQDADDSRYPESQELHGIGSNFGKAFGFKKIGIHHERLPPGRRTSYPHAESDEEEFVYVLEGHPHVWINGVVYELCPGEGVGFRSGTGVCHTFLNNTATDVRLLVVGEKSKKTNKVIYPLNPEMKKFRHEIWWDDAPPQRFGSHLGIPQKGEDDLFRHDLELVGEKIILRFAREEDYPTLKEILSDLKTMSELRYLSRVETGGWTLDQVRERYESRNEARAQRARLDFVVVEKSSGKILGNVGFNHIDLKHRCADFGIILHHPFWGKGFAAEAHFLGLSYGFEKLKLHRVDFSTFTTNTKMRRFFEKIGASEECTRKEAFLVDGLWKDDVIYRILEADWPIVRRNLLDLA